MDIIKKYWNNELFKASFILIILLNLSNILNYIFHFIMGRMLGPTDYGVLATLTSLIYIFSVPTSSIQTLVAKHTTKLNINRKYGKIKGIFKSMMLEALLISIVLFSIYSIASIFLSSLLNISLSLMIITGLYIFFSFMYPLGLGVLQGMKKFDAWGWNLVINSSVKIIIAITLVVLGFRVYGPILGFIFGVGISFALIFSHIKIIMNSKESKERVIIISKTSISTLLSILIITLMYSLDIIFAKILFPSDVAGKYSVASMIGKMIFFGTYSVSAVMFPISSEKYLRKDKNETKNVIKKSFFIISTLCILAISILWIFPELIIKILFGNEYIDVANIIIYLAIAYSFIAITNTFILYKLAIEEFRIRYALTLCLFLFLEIIAFLLFKENIKNFSIAFMFSAAITFFGSLILFKKWKKSV